MANLVLSPALLSKKVPWWHTQVHDLVATGESEFLVYTPMIRVDAMDQCVFPGLYVEAFTPDLVVFGDG